MTFQKQIMLKMFMAVLFRRDIHLFLFFMMTYDDARARLVLDAVHYSLIRVTRKD